MPFTTFPIPTNPWVTWSWPTDGQSFTRTGPKRAADVRNMIDWGCDPTGVADCSAIITAALASLSFNGTGSGGEIFFPPGTYLLNSAVTLPSIGLGGAGEAYRIYGHGALIKGNFPDFLFRRPQNQDNSEPKEIAGLVLRNTHSAGGLISLSNSGPTVIRNIDGQCNGIGFTVFNGNENVLITGCTLRGNSQRNSVGIALRQEGCTIIGCDLGQFDRAITLQSAACVLGNRFELNNWGIVPGVAQDFQWILSISSSTQGGGFTKVNLSNTLLFGNGESVTINDVTGTGHGINGTWTISNVTATSFDIPHAFSADSWGNETVYVTNAVLPSTSFGTIIAGNNSEANGIFIRGWGMTGCVILGNSDQLHSDASRAGFGAPGGIQSRCSVWIPDFTSCLTIQSQVMQAAATLGGIYYGGGGGSAAPFNFAITANGVTAPQGLQTGLVSGTNSNVPAGSPINMYEIPRWLVGGNTLTIASLQGASVPGGTTVSSVNTGAKTITLSGNMSGTMTDGSGIVFASNAGLVSLT